MEAMTHPSYAEYNNRCSYVNAKLGGFFSCELANGIWHCWQGTGAILLSNEPTRKLMSFPDTDKAINWLFTNGHRPAARELHQAAKRFKAKAMHNPNAMLHYHVTGAIERGEKQAITEKLG